MPKSQPQWYTLRRTTTKKVFGVPPTEVRDAEIELGTALQSLINQADKLCELSLTASNKLLLT
jgi:hypothetical protein